MLAAILAGIFRDKVITAIKGLKEKKVIIFSGYFYISFYISIKDSNFNNLFNP